MAGVIMCRRLAVLGCAIAIGGCQTPPPEPSGPGDHTVVVHPGDAAVSVVGTPFYLVFKSVVCLASVAIAAPVAGLAALSESPFAPEIRRDLGDGVNQNCGPPYVLSPYRAVPTAPEVSAPAPRPEPPPDVPEVPAPPLSLEPPPGIPDMQAPEQPPPDDSSAPTEKFPEPAAGSPIELFKT
jgi:hypothetical protein